MPNPLEIPHSTWTASDSDSPLIFADYDPNVVLDDDGQIVTPYVHQTPAEWIQRHALEIVQEVYRREFQDALKMYQAVPLARPFHRSRKRLRLLIGPNQSGKTLSASAEFARIVLGRHPCFPKRDGLALVVGIHEEHIARNMWPTMVSPGQFQLIPHEITGAPRALHLDPDDPAKIHRDDIARHDEWFDAPALLPEHEWNYRGGIAWEDKALGCPRLVKIKSTGWQIIFRPSGGDPIRGIRLNYAWFDEEIKKADWFYETLPRLLRRRGWFTWSATPQEMHIELWKLHKRFLAGDPQVDEFKLSLEKNPFIPADTKREMYNTLAALSDEQLRVRYFGEWGMAGRLVYPQWNTDTLMQQGFE